MIYAAAGVTAADSQETLGRKVGTYFNANVDKLTCDRLNFRPRFGSVLKLAILTKSEPFIDEALRVWRVDLNHVDVADGFTALDFIEQRMMEYQPDASGREIYSQYYRRFRSAGAKHRFEIAVTGKALPPVESTQVALAKLESKAQGGDFYSAIRLADIYVNGRILNGPIPPDPSKARLWLERAGNLVGQNSKNA